MKMQWQTIYFSVSDIFVANVLGFGLM